MKRVRIVVSAMPRMLRDIIEDAVSRQADMELIDVGEDCDLSSAVSRSSADVVIVADQAPLGSAPHEHILIENPHLKMFVVTDDGRHAHLLEFRQIPIVEVSAQRMVDAIRAAVGSGNGPRDAGHALPSSFTGVRET